MSGPRSHTRLLARRTDAPAPAAAARFRGWGLLSLPLESGDVIAFRHAAASSLGPPFNCLWHRSAEGEWRCCIDIAPPRSCFPYHAPVAAAVQLGDISVQWRGPLEVCICVAAIRLSLAVRLAATGRTRLVGGASTLLGGTLRADWLLRGFGLVAGLALEARPLRLTGRSAAGYSYRLWPTAVWQVCGVAAVLAGRDLGGLATPRAGPQELPARALALALTEEFTRESHGA